MKSLHSLAYGPIYLYKCINAIRFLQYTNKKHYLYSSQLRIAFYGFFLALNILKIFGLAQFI